MKVDEGISDAYQQIDEFQSEFIVDLLQKQVKIFTEYRVHSLCTDLFEGQVYSIRHILLSLLNINLLKTISKHDICLHQAKFILSFVANDSMPNLGFRKVVHLALMEIG